ncbi:ATP-binding protein [Paenibacillus sp. 1P07SE]|uniref:ATP-binding protein n=1 Tax=Paenibacillus sp. 1P07SE TaxID=3132209 RepID=UPI0039A5C327
MSRFHVFPFLIPKGVCYEIRTVFDSKIHYFKDETLWSNVLSMLMRPWYSRWIFQPWMSWELDADVNAIRYKLWVPSEQIGAEFQSKFYSEHPEADIRKVEDEPWDFTRKHAGTKLLLERHFVVPLKIYHNDVVDTQAELIALLEGLNEDERVRLQFLVKPTYRTERHFQKAFRQLHEEEDDDESMETENELYKTAIQGKKARLRARVSVKITTIANEYSKAKALLSNCRHSFGQFSSGELNRLYGREWWHILRPLYRYEFKRRIYPFQRPKKRVVFSADEMAMLMRLPSGKVECNKLQRLKMRRTPLPLEVEELQARGDGSCVPIGVHEYHGKERPVAFDLKGWSRHMAVWGGTMMGKSTFLYNLLEEVITARTEENTTGFTVIDPHGSLTRDIASRIPKDQQHLVRYIRFKDGNFPFNVYDVDFTASPDKIAQNVADVCKRVWRDFWGPNVDDNFLNGGIALQTVKDANLDNLRRLLEDDDYRASVLTRLRDEVPLEYQLKLFLSKYDGLDERIKEPKINSTLNKLRKLTLSGTIGGILRAATNGIRWREGMDQGYYTLFDLSGLTIDERRFIGSMCLTFSQLAMLSREDALSAGAPMPMHPVIVDEAPTFMDQSADAIQSFADEARKYNVPLVLGMQGLEGQVPDQVASAIFRNFGTLVAYRVGNIEDAETIYKGMKADYLSAEDFQRVEPNYAYVRMAIGRETTLPFLVNMHPPKPAKFSEDVDLMIAQTLARAEQIEHQMQAAQAALLEEAERKQNELEEAFEERVTEVEQQAKDHLVDPVPTTENETAVDQEPALLETTEEEWFSDDGLDTDPEEGMPARPSDEARQPQPSVTADDFSD